MIEELNVFLPKSKTESLVDWLFGEIEALKSKRRVPTDSPRRKKEKKKKKKERRKQRSRSRSPIEVSSDSAPEPPPIIPGRRERIKSKDEDKKKTRRGRTPTFSPDRTKSRRRSLSPDSDDRSSEIVLRKSPKRKSRSRSPRRRRSRSRSPRKKSKKSKKDRTKSPSMIDKVNVEEFGAPPGSNRFVPRSLKAKQPRGVNMKVSPVKRKIEDRNPFSASESENELQGEHLPKAKVKPLVEADRPRSRGSNREEADMAISDVEQMPSDNESSTKSNPKLVANGQLQGSEKKETRLKQILESKRLNRQNKESSETTGAKSDLRAQLDAKFPDPPSPSKSADESFGPSLPPQSDDLRREVLVNQSREGSMSPVPTDEDEETEKDSITKIKITRKIKNDKKTTVSVDTENNQIIGKRSEKDILEDKLKQERYKIMSKFREPKQNNRTQLHHLASKGDLYKLRSMLEGSDLILTDARKSTVLHELARGGYLFQVTPLIQPHMLVLPDINGVSPLHECAKRSELIQLKTIAWYPNLPLFCIYKFILSEHRPVVVIN